MSETPSPQRFEDQLARLEQVVNRLEDESVGLEEALELFEGGMELAHTCRQRLEQVEQRVARLLAPEESGEPGASEPGASEPGASEPGASEPLTEELEL